VQRWTDAPGASTRGRSAQEAGARLVIGRFAGAARGSVAPVEAVAINLSISGRHLGQSPATTP
jgi:hypothetical protein